MEEEENQDLIALKLSLKEVKLMKNKIKHKIQSYKDNIRHLGSKNKEKAAILEEHVKMETDNLNLVDSQIQRIYERIKEIEMHDPILKKKYEFPAFQDMTKRGNLAEDTLLKLI